jgi:hypothetical protein
MRPGVRILAVATAGLATLFGAAPGFAGAPLGSVPAPVPVGPGSVDASTRQVVRTAAGRVYVFAVDDDGPLGAVHRLRVYRATTTGIPTAFAEVATDDPAAPVAAAPLGLSGVDVRLDGSGVARVVFLRDTGPGAAAITYATFATGTDAWGAAEIVAPTTATAARGVVAAAIALDAAAVVNVAIADPGGVSVLRRANDGTWTADAGARSVAAATHPALTFDRLDHLHLAWLEGSQIRYAVRAAGTWAASIVAATGARPAGAIDQGPSLAVDASDRPVIGYATAGGGVGVHVLDAAGAFIDDSPTVVIGGRPVALTLRNDDRIVIGGHAAGANPGLITRRDADRLWSDVGQVIPPTPASTWTGGASLRFDVVRENDCTVIDGVVGDDDSDVRGGGRADIAYVAVPLAGPSSGDGSCTETSSGSAQTPTVQFTARPTAGVVDPTTTFAWTTGGAVADLACSIDGSPFTACVSPLVANSALGPHSLRVTASNAAGSNTASATWTGVLARPTVTLLSRPGDVAESHAATFAFSRTGVGSVWCKLDSDVFRGCASPLVYPNLVNGAHAVTIQIQNAYGSTVIGPLRWTIAKATAPPSVHVTSGPDPIVGEADAVIAWSTVGVVATSECRVDAAAWSTTACYSPLTVTVGKGPHTFDVRVTNSLGTATDSWAWTMANPPPKVEITNRPPASSPVQSATIGWTTTGAVASTSCSLDGGPPLVCTSPRLLDGLGFGSHSFTVTVAGAAGAGSASVDWTVTPASIAFSDRPAEVTASTGATFAWTIDGPADFVSCRLDDGAFASCISPTSIVVPSGAHAFTVRATSAKGDSTRTVSWAVKVDQVASGGIDIGIQGRPAPRTTATDATIAWATGGAPAADLTCAVDGGPRQPCTSPLTITGLAIGEHAVEIRATTPDATGARVVAWIVSPPEPHVRLTSFPSDPTPDRTGTFRWTTTGQVAAVTCSLDDGAFAACTSPATFDGLRTGRHTVVIRATGPNGEDRATLTWLVANPMTITVTARPPSRSRLADATTQWDTSAPASATTCVIDGAEAVDCASPFTVHALEGGDHTIVIRAVGGAGEAKTSVAFTTAPTGPLVFLTRKPVSGLGRTAHIGWRIDGTITGQQCRIDGGPWRVCASPRILPDLAPGRHSFEIHVWSGKLSSNTTARWTVWGVPSIRLTAHPSRSAGGRVAVFRWRVGGTVSRLRCSLDGGPWRPCGRRIRYAGLRVGPHVLQLRAVGPAGTGRARFAWRVG